MFDSIYNYFWPEDAPKKTHKVSDELAKFMDISPENNVTKIEVSKFITKYIKEHNLKDPIDRRLINPNNELKNLLELPDDVALNYNILQRYLSKHLETI